MKKLRRFLTDRNALTTVEFVVIFPFFLILVLYGLEVILAVFWWQSVEEAAQLGARLAVVWDPAVTSEVCPTGGGGVSAGVLPTTNCKKSGTSYLYGGSCADGNCAGYSTVSCTGGSGGSCDSNSTAFTMICDRMRSMFGPVGGTGTTHTCPGVTITYSDSGLGFAGGPVIPNVSVSISGVPFDVVDVPILPNIIGTVSTMTATLTGEDLSSTAGGS